MGANAQTTVPTFTTGQVLTAAQMNQSARTGIPVFANTTDRDAAFGGAGEKTLAEGQLCYLEDTNAIQYYDGSTWAAIAGGGWYPLPSKSGEYFLYPFTWNGNRTATEDMTYYAPLYIPTTCTVNRIACATGSTFSGTASVRLGIYNHDSTNVQPSTVLLDAGTVSCTAANTQYEITINQALSVGYYWTAFNMQTSPTTPTFMGRNPTSLNYYSQSVSTANIINLNSLYAYTQASVTGAFATAASLTRIGNDMTVALRMA